MKTVFIFGLIKNKKGLGKNKSIEMLHWKLMQKVQ